MQLQKLIYFAYGWATVYLEEPLIDEPIEAWEFGVVSSSIYHEFKEFRDNKITPNNYMVEIRSDTEPLFFGLKIYKVDNKDKKVIKLLNVVWNIYSKYSEKELSNMTRQEPWIKAIDDGKNIKLVRGSPVKYIYMKDYFTKLQNKKSIY